MATASRQGDASSENKLNCFIDERSWKRKCRANATEGVPVTDQIGTRSLPLVIGIGPAKTASSALFRLLGLHDHILLGDARYRNSTYCCEMELYYFSQRFNGNLSLSEDLATYFPIQTKPEARWLAEKTPQYSNSPIVPYRIRATLQDQSLALVFTVRDPLDAHISNFFHTVQFQRLNSTNATMFLAWSNQVLTRHYLYNSCVGYTLWEYGLIDTPSHFSRAPDWYGVQSIDEGVFERCREPHLRLGEGLRGWMYSQTMLRWRRVLPNVPMMCVFHEDFIKDPTAEGRRVVEFLGLDGGKLTQQLKPYEGGYVGPEQRVRAIDGGNDELTVLEIKQHFEALKGVFQGELEFAKQFCNELERNGYRHQI